MSESELEQAPGLEEDIAKLRAMRIKIAELWLELGGPDDHLESYHTALAEDVHYQALDLLNAASNHIQLLTTAQAWAADPSTGTGQIEVTIQ